MVVFSKPVSDIRTQRTALAPPPIPLERMVPKELTKGNYVTVKLQSVPTDPSSQTYELNVGLFRSGTPESFLEFCRDLIKAIDGQNITTGPGKYAMARRLLAGDALAVFNQRAVEVGNETGDHFLQVLNRLTSHVFPQRALRMQKRYMRCQMTKPRNMTTREYVVWVNKINSYLDLLTLFGENQQLPEDEILDLLEFGVPATW